MSPFRDLERSERQDYPHLRVVEKHIMDGTPVMAYVTDSKPIDGLGGRFLRQHRIAAPGFSHVVRSEWLDS